MGVAPPPPTPVDSLSAGQVDLLLQTVREHKKYLDSSHEDAKRLKQDGTRAAYLLDFDLLYMYMFESEEHPDWAQELQFLISESNTTYIIGPGTQTELVRLKERSSRRGGRIPREEIESRLPELADVLRAANVRAYEEVTGSMAVDDDAYEAARATLDRSRRRSDDANQADALNWAAVVHIRRNAAELGLGFPYLLTGTEPLLNEEAWDEEFAVPISRTPGAAIYSQVLLSTFPDPTDALRHTVQAAFKSATVERDLRSSEAYLHPRVHERDPDLETAVATKNVGDELRRQVESLAEFVKDRVVYSTQRIYDNVDLHVQNIAQQTRTRLVTPTHRSPRRLFDLISSVNAALEASDDSDTSLASLWQTVLTLETRSTDDLVIYELRDRAGRPDKPSYFALEVLTEPLTVVMRWPSSLTAKDALTAISASYERHGERFVEVSAGTSSDIYEFKVELPLELDDLVAAVRDAAGEDKRDGEAHEVRWVRVDGDAFDLYADFTAALPHDPVIGVFAGTLDAAHTADLYRRSSARYLFTAWMRAALSHILAQLPEASASLPPKASATHGNN